MTNTRRNRKYDSAWPGILWLLASLAIVAIFCCEFVHALEMAAW